ncbi:hypothetical protein Dda_1926 [Drechslerella dactyloides]|uniref:Uncharacterized protein n=1 Tax=Drechslerella dactyloides TaxID=74499 RepID=A0AAD6NNG9_DREDA|nr:hypothetical protein Dda_1926 [Drechslerella dactyloides]
MGKAIGEIVNVNFRRLIKLQHVNANRHAFVIAVHLVNIITKPGWPGPGSTFSASGPRSALRTTLILETVVTSPSINPGFTTGRRQPLFA